MTFKPLFAPLGALSLLAACGDGTPFQDADTPAVGTAAISNDIYTVTQGDVNVALDLADATTIGGERVWITAGADRAQVFESDDALAIGGVSAAGTPFAGIAGSPAGIPDAGATYAGGFGVLSGEDDYASGDIDLTYSFQDATLTGTSGALSVDASVTPDGIAGDVDFEGDSGTLTGNFYGADGLAGAFTGDTFGGVIFGTAQ